MATKKKKQPAKTETKTAAARGKTTPAARVLAKVLPQGFRQKSQDSRLFPVVGIGASAGGLEAFEAFFAAMPADCGLAFVLVSHLAPHHSSILPELIQRKTRMNVCHVTDNMKLEQNKVFIIPPNREMMVLNGVFQLFELPKPHGCNLPIDTFFRSLAADQGDRAIGIILSGTGTDGTLGLRAIKGAAGMAMVQDLASAAYDGMPRSAIATGLADYVLPPKEMPDQLLRYVNHAAEIFLGHDAGAGKDTGASMQKIYVLLRSRTGHDFSNYKKNTISRRIQRRMHIHQIDHLNDYVRYLQENEREAQILFKELLIGVTNFFRDPEAFEQLKNKFLPALLQDKPDNYQVRVWVPGCSTGEEAYSLAIVLKEYMEKTGCHFPVQIFGTDLDDDAIATARAGIYPAAITADVEPGRLKKFFIKENDHYRIRKAVREMVIFAAQNIIKDPPFTKLDLLSCRNLLIYFDSELQKKLLPIFHYSLKPLGLLFLGSSETVGQYTGLFTPRDKKWKIYQRQEEAEANHSFLAVTDFPAPKLTGAERPKLPAKASEIDTLQLLKTIMEQSCLPTCVIIDDRSDIVYVHGRTGRFLEPAEGETSINILAMARPGLKAGLSAAISQVAVTRVETVVKDLKIRDNGGYTRVSLTVRPIPDFQAGVRGLSMVVFDLDSGPDKLAAPSPPQKRKSRSDAAVILEDELQYTKDHLQATIEELETANEELKSTNEELQSTNEELQSTNEELETSKEELQSLNEESATVNSELQGRIDEISKSNDDMKNLLAATQIATIFLDADLCINRFTPKVTEIIPLTESDAGRQLSHFSTNLQDINLTVQAKEVLDTLVAKDFEVQSTAGPLFRVRITPYRTTKNMIAGVVITFDDISRLKKGEADTRMLAMVLKNSYDSIAVYDLAGTIIAWNKGAERMYGWSEAEALQMKLQDLVPAGARKELATNINKAATGHLEPFLADRLKKDGTIIQVWQTLSPVLDGAGQTVGTACIERDLTTLRNRPQ